MDAQNSQSDRNFHMVFHVFDEEDLFGFNPCPLNRFLRTTGQACDLAIKWWVHLTRIRLIHRL